MTERLTALDSAFLNYEQPHTPMHVAGVLLFADRPSIAGRPGLKGVFQSIEERLHLVPRYRQKVQMVPLGLGHPVWVDDPDFDLAYHLRRTAVPHPGGKRELMELVSRLHARPLDRRRPLWEIYIIEGLEGGRVGLFHKTHHAMVDGVSAVDLATILLDFDAEGWRPATSEPYRPGPVPGGRQLVEDVVREAAGSIAGAAGAVMANPAGVGQRLVDRAAKASMVRQLFSLLRPVPESPLNFKVSSSRRVDTASISLDRAKAIKNAFGGTVNDVVLAVVGEALHVFLEHRGERVAEDLVYRVMVPVSVRDDSEKSALGNRVAGMFVDLPVGRMPVRRRLEMVRRETHDLKEKQQAVAADRLVGLTSWAPATLHALAGRLEFTNQRFVNLVVSNVPGIQVPMYAGGARLLEAYPLLPLAANMGLVVCVTSYNGAMYFGLVGDYDGLADLEVLVEGIATAFERLERAAGLRPPRKARRIGAR